MSGSNVYKKKAGAFFRTPADISDIVEVGRDFIGCNK